jgi:hypothetical protein
LLSTLNSIATAAPASFIAAHTTGAAPSPVLLAQAAVHSYPVAFWAGAATLAAAALAVAALLPPGAAELGVPAQPGTRIEMTEQHELKAGASS